MALLRREDDQSTVEWLDLSKRQLTKITLPPSPGRNPQMRFLPDGRILATDSAHKKAVILETEMRRQQP